MLQFQLMKKLISMMICISGVSSVYAISMSEAKVFEERAIGFAISKDYQSSFRVMRELIETAEASGDADVAKYGYRFLRDRSLIANESLTYITIASIARVVCENGFDMGMSQMYEILNSKVAATAEPNLIEKKTALMTVVTEKYAAQTPDACALLSRDVIDNEKEIALEKAETLRIIKVREAEKEANKARLINERIKGAPSVFRDMDTALICSFYGDFLLRSSTAELMRMSEFMDVKNIETLLTAEVRRRGLSIDKKSDYIRIGMSECGVYALWGAPKDVNRTVGSWGIHKQLVYGSSSSRYYVYIQNGRVTAFQD